MEGDESLEQGTTEQVDSTQDQSLGDAPASPAEQPQVLDLDSVPKFRYGGREWTPKDFQGAYMMHADYTRKSQQLAEERNFYANLRPDLAKVRANPTLRSEFLKTYPQSFHHWLDDVRTEQRGTPSAQAQVQQQSQENPEYLKRLEQVENQFKEQRQAALDQEINATFSRLSQKYPQVKEKWVIASANEFIEKNKHDPNFKLTDSQWEEIWKSEQKELETASKAFHSKQFKEQQNANLKGKDAGRGGGIPGQAPKVARTIKEASAMMLQAGALDNS